MQISKTLVNHIKSNDLKPIIKYGNRFIVKNNTAIRKWYVFKELHDAESISQTIFDCKKENPSNDILLEAYDKDTDMIEVYKLFEMDV